MSGKLVLVFVWGLLYLGNFPTGFFCCQSLLPRFCQLSSKLLGVGFFPTLPSSCSMLLLVGLFNVRAAFLSLVVLCKEFITKGLGLVDSCFSCFMVLISVSCKGCGHPQCQPPIVSLLLFIYILLGLSKKMYFFCLVFFLDFLYVLIIFVSCVHGKLSVISFLWSLGYEA